MPATVERTFRFALSAGLAAVIAVSLFAADTPAEQRRRMVAEHLEARGIRDVGVLRAMQATPRHLFVPEAVRPHAYEDYPLPIGYEATISQPYIVALMTELLDPAKTHRVLEVGSGSGYQAAVLSQLAGEVYSIELVPELAQSASSTLRELGYRNVTVRQGDGFNGWPEKAPFDRIIVTAAPEKIPETLITQLKRGGRLIAPVGRGLDQELIVIDKQADGTLKRRSEGPVLFVPMRPGH